MIQNKKGDLRGSIIQAVGIIALVIILIIFLKTLGII